MDDSVKKDASEKKEKRAEDFNRRQILHMGWTAPIIVGLAASLPNAAFAQSVPHDDFHLDSHQDAHGDTLSNEKSIPSMDNTK